MYLLTAVSDKIQFYIIKGHDFDYFKITRKVK